MFPKNCKCFSLRLFLGFLASYLLLSVFYSTIMAKDWIMQIVEVKNSLVKISYDTSQQNLVLSGFVTIKDSNQAFIAQVVHLEANSKGNFAILKFILNFDSNGVITRYNGSIPDIKSSIEMVNPQELLELFPVQTPIILGELSQQQSVLKLDKSLFEGNLLVCCEKQDDKQVLMNNFAGQLAFNDKKVLVIDLAGTLSESSDVLKNKIVAGKDFKLPLNYEAINFIYEKGLEDAIAETKATVQDIFLEVQNYVKTIPEKFIPFETFRNVVDTQYQETGLIQLILLKNKLLKFYEAGIFAQNKSEFNSLRLSLKRKDSTVVDLSKVEPMVQREMISYIYSILEEFDRKTYVILNINNTNSDKKLLKQVFNSQKVYSTIICSYSYKYLKELKQLSKDLILFAPIHQQDDFASYNMFLAKLNPHEFVVYGQATQHLPLIVTLEVIAPSKFESEPVASPEQVSPEELLDEQIRRDVDKIYTAPKSEDSVLPEAFEEDDLTEEDLDLIEEIGGVKESQEYPQEDEIEESHIEIVEHSNEAYTPQIQEEPPEIDILPVRAAATPIVPVYSADIEPKVVSDEFSQGDLVTHPKYGRGSVEKLISYGTKTLCSINFDNVGRRLLDPTLAELKKI